MSALGLSTKLLVSTLLFLCLGSQSAWAATETQAGPQTQEGTSPLSPPLPTADQLSREFTYDARLGTPRIAEHLEEGGFSYSLAWLSTPQFAQGFIPEKLYELQQTKAVSAALYESGIEAVRESFAATLLIDEEGFYGAIPLVSLDIDPVYRVVERQVERSIEYPGLLSEDSRQLPEQATFELASEGGPEATIPQVMERTAVFWQTTGYDQDGRPAEFCATVIYRGLERERIIDYYKAKASYQGVVASSSQMMSINAVYELDTVPAPVVEPTVDAPVYPVKDAAAPLAAPKPFVWEAVATAVAIISLLVLLILLLLYLTLYINARLIRIDAYGNKHVLVRRHVTLKDKQAVFAIPAHIALYEKGATTQITLASALGTKEGMLLVTWGGREVLCSALKEVYDFDKELLVTLSEGIIAQLVTDGASDER